jgi:hypothetical protein
VVKFKEKNAKLEEKFEWKKLKEKFKLESSNLRKNSWQIEHRRKGTETKERKEDIL